MRIEEASSSCSQWAFGKVAMHVADCPSSGELEQKRTGCHTAIVSFMQHASRGQLGWTADGFSFAGVCT